MREKSSEQSEMYAESELVFSQRVMRSVIAPPGTAGSKGERLRHAQQRLRWTYSRARDVWYGDPRVSLKAYELRRIEEVSGVKYGRQEVRTNDELIAAADALLQGFDPSFYGAFSAALRAVASVLDRSRAARDGK